MTEIQTRLLAEGGPAVLFENVVDGTGRRYAHPVLVKTMFRLLWDLAALPANGMTADHWNRLLAIALGHHPAADFPDGVHVRRTERVVQVERKPISPPRAREGT